MTIKPQWLMDIDVFFSNGFRFYLWRLKFCVCNWTARKAGNGLAANVERQPELKEISQNVLVQHFSLDTCHVDCNFNVSVGHNITPTFLLNSKKGRNSLVSIKVKQVCHAAFGC